MFSRGPSIGAVARWQIAGHRAAMVVLVGAVRLSGRARRKPRRFSRDASSTNQARSSRPPSIRVRDDSTGFAVSVLTDLEGHYHIGAIPAGTCTRHGGGVRISHRGHRGAGRRRRPHAGAQLSSWSLVTTSETVVVRAEVPLVDRVVGHRRARGHGTDRAADSAERPSLHRSRPARARVGRAVADRLLLEADSRHRHAGLQHRRQSRGVGRVSGQRRAAPTTRRSDRSIFEPPLGEHPGIQGGQLGDSAPNTGTCPARSSISSRDRAPTRFTATSSSSSATMRSMRATSSSSRRRIRIRSSATSSADRSAARSRRGRTFYFASYEGFRQRQGVDMNSVVLSDAQRAAATDPVVRQLIPLIPRANFFDADGTPRFVGSAPAVADQDRWTIDVTAQRRPEAIASTCSMAASSSARSSRRRRATAFPDSDRRRSRRETC